MPQARYLSDLYKKFGDWNLVIAAYNCGADKINKAIRRSHGERDYWKIYPRLPKETRGYVPAFIAANYIMNYYCDHNICPLKTTLPDKTDTVMVDRDVHFEQIAHVLGMDIDEIRDLNPQYRRDIVNGNSGQASLRLPEAMINKFIDNEDSVYAYTPADYQPKRTEVEAEGGHYVVNKNQVTLVSRSSSKKKADDDKADNTGTTPVTQKDDKTPAGNEQKTVSANDSDDDNDSEQTERSSSKRSYRSRKSQSRSSKNSSSSRSRNSKKSKSKKDNGQQSKSVTVKSGDTLSEIAERNHTTVKKLRKAEWYLGKHNSERKEDKSQITLWRMDELEQKNKEREAADNKMINDAFQHLLDTYLASPHRKKVDIITKAFNFARQAHKGVRRLSGEPYIMHPIAVAQIACEEMGLGSTSICAELAP